jgi:hypothetical protein
MHLQHGCFGAAPVLSPQTIAAMHAPQADRGGGSGGAYGLTFYLDTYHEMRQVSHAGDISSFASIFTLFPDMQAGVILLLNYGDDFDARSIMQAIHDAMFDMGD